MGRSLIAGRGWTELFGDIQVVYRILFKRNESVNLIDRRAGASKRTQSQLGKNTFSEDPYPGSYRFRFTRGRESIEED